MIPWITLGVCTTSLLVTLFLLWVLAVPHQEEETHVVGFRYTTPEEDDNQDGC